jgi:hypothetical protein
MQLSAAFYPTFGLTLAALFIFGLAYAALVRHISKVGMQGQTAYAVIGGVAVTLALATFVVGITTTLVLLACFSASGLPMVIEYVTRVHLEQRRDREQAAETAREFLK